jgi:hypothetical protein
MADRVENVKTFNFTASGSSYSGILNMYLKKNLVIGVTFTDIADTSDASDTFTLTLQQTLDPNAVVDFADSAYNWQTIFTKTWTDVDLKSAAVTNSTPYHLIYDAYDFADLSSRAKGVKGIGANIRAKLTAVKHSGAIQFKGSVQFGYDVAVTSS